VHWLRNKVRWSCNIHNPSPESNWLWATTTVQWEGTGDQVDLKIYQGKKRGGFDARRGY